MEPLVVLIGGTGVRGPFADWYYQELLRQCPGARFIPLPIFGLRNLRWATAEVLAKLDAMSVPSEQPLILVGQSQGGLVASAVALHIPAKVVALSAPFDGTRLCYSWMPGALGDMAPGSDFTRQLRADLSEALADKSLELHSFTISHDMVIQPAWSSYFPGACNHVIAHDAETFRRLAHLAPADEISLARVNHISAVAATEVAQLIRETIYPAAPLHLVS